jgi:NitT/TauT family transport system ATP-binding protein
MPPVSHRRRGRHTQQDVNGGGLWERCRFKTEKRPIMGATVSLDYITHRFGRGAEPTLQEVNGRVNSGELIAIIGRSGCGKSTLLHMMAGLLMPSEGCVRIDGNQVTKPSAKWNMMFQDASLYPWMSVRENAALGLLFAGVNKRDAQAQVEPLLDMVGLSALKDAKPQNLSGGQQQRVALARSLATNPDVLLLDEPFSALDAFTRTALQGDVPGICRERGITMVIVTHDIDEAIAMADRVLIMSRNPGRLIGELPVDLPWPRDGGQPAFQALRAQLMDRFKNVEDDAAEDTQTEKPTPTLVSESPKSAA